MRIGKLVPLLALTVGCGTNQPVAPVSTASATPQAAPEPTPALRLPAGVTPRQQTIELTLDPRKERYSGKVEIDIDIASARSTVWLNGRDLDVKSATITPAGASPLPAKYAQRGASGIAALSVGATIPAGKAHISISFEAAFAKGQKGLYKVEDGGEPYLFTQFEAIAARSAFPCFDEPGFKIPYAMRLIVPKGMQAISNTRELSRTSAGELDRLDFRTTEQLPSYLLAVAVGHFDVVEAPDIAPNEWRKTPLSLRAVTTKGRGKEASYALAHTGEILAKLEAYTGIGYPYDKLDIIAVPGKNGAMENVGAVTFGEFLVLLDPKKAPVHQRRAYAQVMAHELAHMWVGNLVTMQWWDDLWLNEAFATWLGEKVADQWDPTVKAEMALLQGIQQAIGTDSLVSARAIRQPITSTDDIENAFDGITYRKGGGVIAMFERYLGSDVWRKGFNAYLKKHSHGNATADDLLDELDAVSKKDVKGAFHSFLDQVGVPFIEVSSSCNDPERGKGSVTPATIRFKQSRYLPLGSAGDANKTWQVPVCVRYGGDRSNGEACTLLTSAETSFALPASAGCPQWIFPNANAAGYFRFSLAQADLEALRKHGLKELSVREKVAYANSIRAGYNRGVTPFGDALTALAPLASEEDSSVAAEPMGLLGQALDFLYDDPLRQNVERYGQKLYGPVAKKLGWDPNPGESADAAALRVQVIGFLAGDTRDPATRKEAMRRGRAYLGIGSDEKLHVDAVSPDLAGTALGVVGQEADLKTWDHLRALFGVSEEEAQRGRLLWALSEARNSELRDKVRALVFDPALRDNEVMTPIWGQVQQNDAREATWQWLKTNQPAISKRLPKHHGGVQIINVADVFCDEAHAADAEAFFEPKVSTIEGAPRTLSSVLESIRLCVAKRKTQEPHMRAFFAKK